MKSPLKQGDPKYNYKLLQNNKSHQILDNADFGNNDDWKNLKH